MPKVIHIVLGKANPDRLNGVNKVVHAVAAQSIQTGRDVEVWGFTPQPDNTSLLSDFTRVLFKHRPYSFALDQSVRDAVKSQPRDTVFHIHGGLIPLYYSLARFLKQQKRPYIVTLHGCLQWKSLQQGLWYKFLYVLLFERFILQNAYAVHCITGSERQILQRLTTTPTYLIPNGAVPVSNLPLQGQPDTAHGIRFLFMGRFAMNHKGLDILIQAFAIFQQVHRDAYLFLAGAGDDQKNLRDLIKRHHIKHHIRILPPQFHAEKSALLDTADIFIHTSRWDVLPTACLEAAAHGKPLLVTQATGFASFIDKYHCGWVAKTLSPAEVAQRMTDAYASWKHNQLAPIGRNAYHMIAQELNWPDITERFYNDLYNHAAA